MQILVGFWLASGIPCRFQLDSGWIPEFHVDSSWILEFHADSGQNFQVNSSFVSVYLSIYKRESGVWVFG